MGIEKTVKGNFDKYIIASSYFPYNKFAMLSERVKPKVKQK